MFINITDSDTADNKGSSNSLAHYLDKENRANKDRSPELWFNGDRRDIPSYETVQAIDNNIAKLGRGDAKFFLVNISPSQKEIAFLKTQYGDDGAKEQLKAYAAKMMDEYARNFKRPGVESNQDLLWFGKLENHRYYGHKDPEVKQGLKKRGEQKPGEQMHIQVVVSRKDIANKIKLSPMNNSRGKNAAHSQRMGQFDRSVFKQSGETLFDEKFGFERGLKETFQYANTQRKGSLEQRIALRAKYRNQQATHQQRPSAEKQISLPQQEPKSYLAIALAKTAPDAAPGISRKKKKRKTKGQSQDEELTL